MYAVNLRHNGAVLESTVGASGHDVSKVPSDVHSRPQIPLFHWTHHNSERIPSFWRSHWPHDAVVTGLSCPVGGVHGMFQNPQRADSFQLRPSIEPGGRKCLVGPRDEMRFIWLARDVRCPTESHAHPSDTPILHPSARGGSRWQPGCPLSALRPVRITHPAMHPIRHRHTKGKRRLRS